MEYWDWGLGVDSWIISGLLDALSPATCVTMDDRPWRAKERDASGVPIINGLRAIEDFLEQCWWCVGRKAIGEAMTHARRSGLAVGALLAMGALAPWAAATSRGGPAFTSGGDFPGESSCTRCHYYRIDTGPGEHQLEIDGVPASEYAYVPGETVSMILKFQDEDARVNGFLLTARSGDGCDSGGSFAPGPLPKGDRVKVRQGDSVFLRPEPCGDRLKEVHWATHSLTKEGTSVEWEMLWTPPDTFSGPVTIAYAINGADGNGAASFDSVYFGQVVVQASTETLDAPVITDGGFSLVGLADGDAVAALGSFASLEGMHFAVSDGGRSALDESGLSSTVIDDVCVEVGTHRAPLYQVTADSVLFEIPLDAGLGATSVRVIRFCDMPGSKNSESIAFTTEAVRPRFLEFDDGETTHLAAVRRNLELFAAAGAIGGHRTRPAVPGDLVTVFGSGFGPLDPAREAGEVVHGLRERASSAFRVLIGLLQVPATDMVYVGAAPHYGALQQVTFRVPTNVAAGSHTVRVFADGVAAAAGSQLEVAMAVEAVTPQSCSVDLELSASDRCSLMIGGLEALIEIDVDGKACVLVPADSTVDRWTCGESELDLGALGAEIRITKDDDGDWTVTDPPDPMVEPTP